MVGVRRGGEHAKAAYRQGNKGVLISWVFMMTLWCA